jgi:hypothetical protein
MLTADVLALTTRVDKQVAAKTPLVRVLVSVLTWRHRRSSPDRKLGHRTGASSHSSARLSSARLLTGRTRDIEADDKATTIPANQGSLSRFKSSSSGSESRPAYRDAFPRGTVCHTPMVCAGTDRRPPAVRIEQVFVADLLIPKSGAPERPRLGGDERVDRRRKLPLRTVFPDSFGVTVSPDYGDEQARSR